MPEPEVEAEAGREPTEQAQAEHEEPSAGQTALAIVGGAVAGHAIRAGAVALVPWLRKRRAALAGSKLPPAPTVV